jgi:hypothetical protein
MQILQKPRINATPLGQYKATFIPSAWLTPKDEPLPQEIDLRLLEDTDLDAELLLVVTSTEVQVGL